MSKILFTDVVLYAALNSSKDIKKNYKDIINSKVRRKENANKKDNKRPIFS